MNRVIDWLRRLRLSSRLRRVELLSEDPGAQPDIPVECFLPDLGQEQRLQRIRAKVAQLGAESFDEATDRPFDELITQEGTDWERSLDQQHEAFKARAGHRLAQARADAWRDQQLLEEDAARLLHAEIAVESALLALSGYDAAPRLDLATAITVRTRQPGSAPATPGRAMAGDFGSPGAAEDPSAAAATVVGQVLQPDGVPAVLPEPALGLDGLAILAPPRVSRTELRRLIEPQDASRVPRWEEPGFRDGSLLAGRPRGAYLHVIALLIAAGADVGAFAQTVQLVLPEKDYVAWLVVGGLTVSVLYVAHMIGAMLREAKAARLESDHHSGQQDSEGSGRTRGGRGRELAVLACMAVWLAVGVLAFWVRFKVPLVQGVSLSCLNGPVGGGAGASCSGSADPHRLEAAAIFFGLYLATGLVAAVGAYFTHNPFRSRYTAALRAYRKASERYSASVRRFGRAEAGSLRQRLEIAAAETILAQARERNASITAQLKQTARMEIAALARDPAVTDAYFQQGR